MRLQEAFLAISETATPTQFDRFRSSIDPAWIEEALVATGTASMRRRRLPADQVLWLVIGMALFRNESIARIVAQLDLALPDERDELVAPSAISQARRRLGHEPLEYLFAMTGAQWAARSADRHRWRGLAVYALDGSTLTVADSPDNRQRFGLAINQRDASAYPLVRVLALMAARSHLLAAIRFDGYSMGETTLARDLWREVPDHSVLLIDRNLIVAEDLIPLERIGENRHWISRKRVNAPLTVVEALGPNDAIVEKAIDSKVWRRDPSMPRRWRMRAITYQRPGYPPSTLLTSLLDPIAYPAHEVAAMYHERWEAELGYDEVKTHLLLRQESIRSRTPAGVIQEILGIALAYNLVRMEMERVADEAGVPPTRISFVNALWLVRNLWLWSTAPPLAPARIPARIVDLRRNIKLLVLPPRRTKRRYPRVVKKKYSRYLRNRRRSG
jgi:hypothetical protein